MGLPADLPNLRLHCADAAAFLRQRLANGGPGQQAQAQQAQQVQAQQQQQQAQQVQAQQQQQQAQQVQAQQQQQAQQEGMQPYDLIYMDTFDGDDNVPATLRTPGVLGYCGAATPCLVAWQGGAARLPRHTRASSHSAARSRCAPHGPSRRPSAPTPAEFAAQVAAALHPAHGCFLLNLHSLDDRRLVGTFRSALLLGDGSSGGGDASSSSGSGGSCFAVSAQRQRNVCVALSRGLQMPRGDAAAARRWLFFEAQRVAEATGYRFPAGSRACQAYQPL